MLLWWSRIRRILNSPTGTAVGKARMVKLLRSGFAKTLECFGGLNLQRSWAEVRSELYDGFGDAGLVG